MHLALLTLCSLSVAAQADQAPEAPAHRFIVHSVNGPLPPAPLLELSADFSLRTGGDKPGKVAAGDLVALRRADASLPPFLSENVLVLTSGERWPLPAPSGQTKEAAWRLEEDRLFFQPGPPLKAPRPLQLSVNHAAVLCLAAAPKAGAESEDDREQFLCKLLREDRPRDVIVLTDGDRLEGNLKKLDAVNGASLEVNGRERRVPAGKIRAVAFNSEFKARPRPKGAYGFVVLASGGRVGLLQPDLDGKRGVLGGKTLFGGNVEVPLSEMRSLSVRNGAAVYLSDLPVKSYEYTPFLKTSWDLGKDETVLRQPLRLASDTFDKGLGMHSQSQVVYRLDGKYRWFEAVAGLDEKHGRLGRVRLRVLVDGQDQNLGPGVAPVREWKDGLLALRIDVKKAQELALIVEFAGFGDVQGQVNWCDARLIK